MYVGEDESGIVGETTTWNEVIDVAEKITGKKLQRTYLKEGDSETAKKLLERDFYSSVSYPAVSFFASLTKPTFPRRFTMISLLGIPRAPAHQVRRRWPLGRGTDLEQQTTRHPPTHR